MKTLIKFNERYRVFRVQTRMIFKTLQPARLKSQRELRFESAVPVAIFDLTNTLPVAARHLHPSPINYISVCDSEI
jgi:hypothetical protein